MKLFADMLRKKGGYDPEELKAPARLGRQRQVQGPHLHQHRRDHPARATGIYTGGNVKPPALTAADRPSSTTGLALYLILRNYMRDVNAVGGGWTNQLAWGSDRRGLPHDDGRHRRVALQLDRGPHRPQDRSSRSPRRTTSRPC